jgi:predicted site-specific integrase-resolvase
MLRSLLPQTAPHSSARQYKELQNQIATLKAEKESLMQRKVLDDYTVTPLF